MIEAAMYVALGFCTAGLIGLAEDANGVSVCELADAFVQKIFQRLRQI